MATNRSQARLGRPRLRDRAPHDVESLVDVAVGEFNEKGYDGVSMDDLARAAGVTKAALYHHVSGKQELLERAFDRALDALFAVLEEPEALDGPAVERVRHVLRRTVGILVDQQPAVALLLRVRAGSPIGDAALARRRDFEHSVAELVREAADHGDVRADLDPALLIRLAFGTISSIAEWYRPDAPLGDRQLVEAIDAFLTRGFRG
ncbi:MAG: transcriptional regulator, TetR family [Solirubrobacterales bacterium]|nr:transcriptional regulator, TetR family [Solirubrobacterales bacterium]